MHQLMLYFGMVSVVGCVAQDPTLDPGTTTNEQASIVAGLAYTGPSLTGSGTASDPVIVAGASTAALNSIATSDGAGGITWQSAPTLNGFGVAGTGRVGIGITQAQAQARVDVATENGDDSLQLRRYTNNSNAVKVDFVKAQGTIAAPLAVAGGTNIFSLNAYGYDGSQNRPVGALAFGVDAGFAQGIAPGKLQIFTTDTSGTSRERFRVDSLGHWVSPLQVAPAASGCGSGPIIAGTDVTGVVTEGAGASGCTISFARPYSYTGNTVHCTITSEAGVPFRYVVSGTGITITNLGALAGTSLDYTCIGN